MRSFNISFPWVHKKSSLPTFVALLGFFASIPVIMVLWVAICSQFTRVEGTNETALYNVYICIRALFAITILAGAVIYDFRRASIALLPGAALGVVSSIINFIITFSVYLNKKAIADAMSISSSYTQNYIDIFEAGILAITAILVVLYLLGLFKTSFPCIFIAVIATLVTLYSVFTYSTTYQVNSFTVLSKSYTVFYCIAVLLFCLSSVTKAQLEGTVKKEKYVPRRMKT